jgi:UDP-2-acetamido-3-amino-2,3-dideoxy-glucuronate N-acetyltransferase
LLRRFTGWQAHMDEPRDDLVDGVSLIRLSRIDGDNGSLIVGELGAGLPFVVRRIFTLLDIPSDEPRGIHAHRKCEQFLICLSGSVTAVVDDGSTRREVILDDPTLGLYMPAMTWGTQYRYSPDAILLVLASDAYDAGDYINDYSEFRALRGSV